MTKRLAALAALGLLLLAAGCPVRAAEDAGQPVVLVPPEKEVPFGLLRIEAAVRPPCVKVEFFLDDRKLVTRNRAPYTVEIDLGSVMARHVLRIAGYDAAGTLVGTDTRVFNDRAVLARQAGDVTVQVSAVDGDGRPVEGLRADELEVLEGAAVRPVLAVEPAAPRPITLGLMLDASARMKDALASVRDALPPFVTSVIRSEADRGFVVVVRDAAQVAAPATSNVAPLLTALGDAQAMGGCALRDGLVLALYQFDGGRRALLLLTEGTDSNSHADFETILLYARKASVPVYAVAVNPGMFDFGQKSRLKELAAATGGETFTVGGKGLKELPAVLQKIEADLKSQLLVRFAPAPGGSGDGVRPFTLRVKRPGVRVRTISAYPG